MRASLTIISHVEPFAVGADVVYLVGILHISASFDEDSQLLVGGVFNVATRVSSTLAGWMRGSATS